jgi:hypothetical protein
MERRRQMHGVRSTDEEIPRSGKHQRTGSSQQSFGGGNEVPQSGLSMLGEMRGQVARVVARQCAFTRAAMQQGVELNQGPQRRMDDFRCSDKLANLRRVRLIEVELRNIRRVEIHDG